MVDTPKTAVDFENMSDEDFLKLDEEDYSGNVPEGETSLTNEELHAENQEQKSDPEDNTESEDTDNDESSSDNSESDDTGDNNDPNAGETSEANEDQKDMGGRKDSHQDEDSESETDDKTPSGEQPKENTKEEGKTPTDEVTPQKGGKETPAKAGYYKLPEGIDTTAMDTALGFYQQITAPFKADGKDFSVRSPEDAIRLIQQGVNYSRRMQELKPMKTLNRMLSDQGLNDPTKLNFLIDLSKGDKAAITQLLKSHKIDPMDLDTEKDTGYQANNYQGDSQDNSFRDALDEAIANPEGQALVAHIHKDWDQESKAQLRENPVILGNLQELKASGVYDKVVEELEYQKRTGYLLNVPFLKAFDQVGEAMRNAGVFKQSSQNPAPQANPMVPITSDQLQDQPVASGARKAPTAKKLKPNPHLSSTPPSKQINTQLTDTDFDKLSDEEFLKMAPPE